MPRFGPLLSSPLPQDVPIWTWLFRGIGEPRLNPAGSKRGGFRDYFTGEYESFDDIKEKAISLSTALTLDLAVVPKQNVAIVCNSSVWYPTAMFAAIRLGATVTSLASSMSTGEITYCLQSAATQIVFVDSASLKTVQSSCHDLGIPQKNIILMTGEHEKHRSLQDLINKGRDRGINGQVKEWEIPSNQPNRDVCAYLAFSSGTTGLPKAVMISHGNVIAQITQMRELISKAPPLKNLLAVLPFYHITGLVHLLHLPIVLNQNVIIMAHFEMEAMLNAVMKHKCNELWLVPPLLIRMANENVVDKYDLSSVKQFNTGAAPLSKEIISKLELKYPSVAIRQAWGMTETCSCLTVTPAGLMSYENAHKVGKIVPDTELKVVDLDTGEEMKPGGIGEILARGPQITLGYLNNDVETKKVYMGDGYFRTGDIGSIEEDGFVIIHDRLKEMIKVKGHGVAPAELEDLLLGHPNVIDVAVIGIPDERSGEVPKAYVVVKPGADKTDASRLELEEFVQKNKIRYKWIKGGVEFVDEIPKSAAGKILRRVLRERSRENKGLESNSLRARL